MLVRAKRSGWDRRDGAVTDTDDFDPPDWVDAGLDEWVEGELEVTELPGDDMYKERKVYRVDGESVDPSTVEELGIEEKGIGESVQSAGRWLAGKWEQLEGRYGRKAALAMAVGMLATLPVPGNIAAVIAVAEGIRGVHGYFQRACGGDLKNIVFPTLRTKGSSVAQFKVGQKAEVIDDNGNKWGEGTITFIGDRTEVMWDDGSGGGMWPNRFVKVKEKSGTRKSPRNRLKSGAEQIEIECDEQWMPKQIWINLGEPAEYQPYFVGGKYNATLRLFRRDGGKITRADSDAIRQDVLGQYPGQVRVYIKGLVQKASPDQVLAAMEQIGHGSDKHTSLRELGQRVGGSPQSLHQAVMQLWRDRKVTVSPPEGRHGSTPEDRRWWMEAQGETFGYVSLRL